MRYSNLFSILKMAVSHVTKQVRRLDDLILDLLPNEAQLNLGSRVLNTTIRMS